jgi:hypothetical protein
MKPDNVYYQITDGLGEQVLQIIGSKILRSLIFMEHAQTTIFNYLSEQMYLEKKANDGVFFKIIRLYTPILRKI